MENANEDDEGLDDSNIDLLPANEKVNNPSDEDSTTTIKHELVMERTISSDSDDQFMNKKEHPDEAPIMQRKLFGPPCWNPEQLAAAIDSVKNGSSVTGAARQFGIPRTTLSNKIYGRRRRLYNQSVDPGSVQHFGLKRPDIQDTSLTYVIGSENEKLVAAIIQKQKLVDPFSMTRAIFDIVKYLAQDKGHVLKDDEEVKEWIQYFFMRYPSAYFPVTLFELRMAHADDEYFADYAFETSKAESAEDVMKKLMSLITRRLLIEKKVLMNIHLFWWYTFLTTFTDVRDYFMDNLTWPDTILNPANLQMVEDKGVHQILTSALLKRNNRLLHYSSDCKRMKLISSDNSDSPTQVTARRSDVNLSHMYDNIPRSSIDSYTYNNPDDPAIQDSNDISSTSTSTSTSTKASLSLGKMLAQEALNAVERKISGEELRYFQFRYENPRLDEAFEIWKNLKLALGKDDEVHMINQ